MKRRPLHRQNRLSIETLNWRDISQNIMELEIINKLFLELSQVATAQTAKEIELTEQRDTLIAALKHAMSKTSWEGITKARQIIAEIESRKT